MFNYKNLKADEFLELLSQTSDAQIIDVRTKKEYLSGHMEGAINIPITNKDELLSLDKDKTYFLHCRVGGRSAIAAYHLTVAGYPKVYNLNDTYQALITK